MKLASPHSDRECLLTDGLAKATDFDQAEGARRVDTMQAVPSALKTITPQCRGYSCRQGRMPCREGCGEMACTAGDDLPGLPALTRARLAWQRFVCGFRR